MIQGRLRTVLAFAVLTHGLVACGDDAEPGKPKPDAGGDTSEPDGSVTPDTSVEDTSDTTDTASGDDTTDTTPLDTSDAGSGEDTTDTSDTPDVDEGPCPGSILCINERTGRPQRTICTQNGYPEGSTCEVDPEQEGVACCVPPFSCETNDDCEAAREDEGFCEDDRFPCVCIPSTGKCEIALCSADSECSDDEICFEGRCQDDPAATTYIARILSGTTHVGAGASARLEAVAVDAANPNRTNARASIAWSIDAPELGATISNDGVFTAGTTAGAVTVRARVAGNSADPGDTLVIRAMGAVPQASEPLRVAVIDEVTRAPIANATVAIGEGEGLTVLETDEDGVVAFADAPATNDIHVFTAGYAFVSAVDVTTRSVLLSVPPIQRAEINEVRDGFVCDVECDGEETVCRNEEAGITLDRTNCGGPGQDFCLCYELENTDVVRGEPDLTNVANVGDVVVSLNGFALGNTLLDLNFDLIVGPSIERNLPAPVSGPSDVPSGITLVLNTTKLIDKYIATGATGERTLWSIGGRISLAENPTLLTDIISRVSGDLEIGQIITIVLPFFEDFYSGIESGLEMEATGTFPVRTPGIKLDVPTFRRVAITAPTLPSIGTGWADTSIILGGALVPGEGFVPLGVTGAADAYERTETPDGRLDGDPSTSDIIDPVRLTMAPLHGGIDAPGSRYMIASVALGLNDANTNIAREAASAILTQWAPGEPLPATLDLGSRSFPALAFGSEWDPETRTLEFGDADASTDLFRVVFKGQDDRPWIIYAPSSTESVVLPAPEVAAFEDRTARNRVNVVSISLRDDSAVGYQSLLTPDGRNLTDLFNYIESFSILGL